MTDCSDVLEFKEDSSGQIQLECDQPDLSTGPDNLICRAAALVQLKTGCKGGARIRLAKRIPMAAGLAGGSTDAAATLAGLNELWQLGAEQNTLAGWSSEIGSDIPFFFSTPAAWCTGRGEAAMPLAVSSPLWFVLACPTIGLSTAEVYRSVVLPATPNDEKAILAAFASGDANEIGLCLHNRLQEPAETLRPELEHVKNRLTELRPAGVAMSGSGTTWFALCRHHREALRVAQGLRGGFEEGKPPRVFIVRSCL